MIEGLANQIDQLAKINPNLPWVRTQAQYDALFFGPSHPNMVAYFSEMSGGQLNFTRAGPGILNLEFDTEVSGDSWPKIAQRAAR